MYRPAPRRSIARRAMRACVALASVALPGLVAGCGGPAATPASAENPAASGSALASVPPAAGGAHAGGAWVELGGGARGWLAQPAGEGKHAAILVIQEWWGVTDWILDDAERFAKQGYVALAVDLYRGKATSDPAEAHELMRGLPDDRVASDMKVSFDYLAKQPGVDAERIGTIGWCMGGGVALGFAASEPRLRAAVVNYGRLFSAPERVAAVRASLLGNFAGNDRGIPNEDVKKLEGDLKAKGKEADFKIYDGKGHAFMNPGNKSGFDETAAKDAWARIDAFFAKTLKAAK